MTPDESLPPRAGALPPWEVAELDAPPPFGWRNALKVIGPGAVMAATSIGGGEWLVGPAAAVKYVRRIEELIGAPVALLSTSPQRDDTILMRDPFQD